MSRSGSRSNFFMSNVLSHAPHSNVVKLILKNNLTFQTTPTFKHIQ